MKKLFFVFVVLLGLQIRTYAQINVGTNYRIMTNLPIDTRMVVADTAELYALNPMYRYDGLQVYVKSEQTNYQFLGGIADSNIYYVNSPAAINVRDVERMRNLSGSTIPANTLVGIDTLHDNSIRIMGKGLIFIGVTEEAIPNYKRGKVVTHGVTNVLISNDVRAGQWAIVSYSSYYGTYGRACGSKNYTMIDVIGCFLQTKNHSSPSVTALIRLY